MYVNTTTRDIGLNTRYRCPGLFGQDATRHLPKGSAQPPYLGYNLIARNDAIRISVASVGCTDRSKRVKSVGAKCLIDFVWRLSWSWVLTTGVVGGWTLATALGGHGCSGRSLCGCSHWSDRICPVVSATLLLLTSHRVGTTGACELLAELAHDHMLPRAFLAPLPYTGALYVAILSFIFFSSVLYASTGAKLIVASMSVICGVLHASS